MLVSATFAALMTSSSSGTADHVIPPPSDGFIVFFDHNSAVPGAEARMAR